MPRISITTTIIVTISLTAVLMAALMFALLPGPGEIIKRMQIRMAGIQRMSVRAEVAYNGYREYRDENYVLRHDPEGFVISSAGWIDRGDGEEESFRQDLAVSVGAEDPEVLVAAELRRLRGRDYAKFGTLPERFGVVSLEPFRGVWLRYDLQSLREAIDAPLFGSSGKELSEAERVELILRFRATPFLVFQERLDDEVMEGRDSHHLKVMPEPLYFKDFLMRMEAMRLARDLTQKERMAVDTFFGNTTPYMSEVWISKKGHYLTRMLLRFRYDEGARDGDVSIDIRFSGFDSKESVTVPEGKVRDVDELLASLLPGIAQHLPLAKEGEVRKVELRADEEVSGLPVDVGMEGGADPDGDGLTNALEAFYLSDPENPDTDGDGVSDGDEIDMGLNPAGPGGLFDFGLQSRLQSEGAIFDALQ